MPQIRYDLKEKITRLISQNNQQLNPIILYGEKGIGKSYFLNELIFDKNFSANFDIILSFDFEHSNQNQVLLPHFLNNYKIYKNSEVSSSVILNESDYNQSRTHELLEQLKNQNIDLWKDYHAWFGMKSHNENKVFQDILRNNVDFNFNDFLFEIENSLSQYFSLKGDIRLLKEINTVAAESLMVDLITYCFPLNKEFDNYEKYLNNSKKTKILFIFDNFDKINYSVFYWLFNHLLPYCYYKKFDELISYNLELINQEAKFSDFFDFYLIFSSRTQPTFIDTFYNYSPEVYKLDRLTKQQFNDFIGSFNFDLNTIDLIFELTGGSPGYINKLLELLFKKQIITKQSDSEELFFDEKKLTDDIKSDYSKLILDYILKDFNEKEIKYIKLAALVNEFDRDYFRCFQENKADSDKIIEWFNSYNYLLENSGEKSNVIKLEPLLKNYLELRFKTESKDEYDKIKEKIEIYKKTKNLLNDIKNEDHDIIRAFAYFDSIDTEFGINALFDTDSYKVNHFLSVHPEYFDFTKHSVSLKKEFKPTLLEYNKILDGPKFQKKIELVNDIWNNFVKKFNDEKNEKLKLIAKYEDEMKEIQSSLAPDKNLYDDIQKNYMEKENELITLRKKLSDYEKQRIFATPVTNLLISLIVLIVAYLFPDIFSTPENHSSIIIIQFILYFISVVFGLISIYNFYKAFSFISNKNKKFLLEEKLRDSLNEKTKLHEQMKKLKENRELNFSRLTELKSMITDLNDRINDINEKLNETYLKDS